MELVSLTGPDLRAEWLRRELGITVRVVGPAEIVARATASPGATAIFVTEPEPYLDVLAQIGPDRIVAMVPNDQHYRPATRAMIASPAIRAAFRPHSIDLLGTIDYVRSVASGLADARPASTSPKQVAAAVRDGLRNRASIRRTVDEVGSRVHMAPIGYSNKFAHAYVDSVGSVAPDASLIEVAIDRMASAEGHRPIAVSFRGTRGQFQRRTGVHLASRVAQSDCTSPTTKFSGLADGLDGEAYVDLLRRSRFSLCPPGFAANESLRLHESLICGALPVLLEAAISQGTHAVAHLDDSVQGRSWRAALGRMARIDEADRRAAVTRSLTKLRDEHRALAQTLATLVATPV